MSSLRLRDVDELRRPDDVDASSLPARNTSYTENGQDDRRSVDNISADLFPVTSSLSQSSGDDMMIGMLGGETTADVVSSTRALRHSRARFASPLVTSLPDAMLLELSLLQLRIGSAARHGRSIGRTDRPARQHPGGPGPTGDLVRGTVCGSDKVRFAMSLDSRIVGNATAVSGSSVAFVNAARYDDVLPTPAVGRVKRSYVNLAVMSRLSFL